MRKIRKELANCMAVVLCLILVLSIGLLHVEKQVGEVLDNQKRIVMLMERNARVEMTMRCRNKCCNGNEAESEPVEETPSKIVPIADESAAVLIEDVAENDDSDWNVLCGCRVFHYCACKRCTGKSPSDKGYGLTATGTIATPNRTIAVDPSVIPLGSEVEIDGIIYTAEDTGVKGKCIDVFVDSHDEAKCRGTYVTNLRWR